MLGDLGLVGLRFGWVGGSWIWPAFGVLCVWYSGSLASCLSFGLRPVVCCGFDVGFGVLWI